MPLKLQWELGALCGVAVVLNLRGGGMKKFLLVSALICAIAGVAAQVAMAGPRLLVTGAGASPVAAQVVLHAEATGPATAAGSPASVLLRDGTRSP